MVVSTVYNQLMKLTIEITVYWQVWRWLKEAGSGLVGVCERPAITAHAMSSRKHRLVGADKESRFWSQRSESDLQVVPVVPFDSMLKSNHVEPDLTGWGRSRGRASGHLLLDR